MRPAIAIEGVSKRFGALRAVDAVSLTVPAGSVFGLLGTNGSGKTTTIRMLLGLMRPDAGTVRVCGLDPMTHGEAVRARVGVLLDHDGLYDRITAWDNLRYHAELHGVPTLTFSERAEGSLARLGLFERRHERPLHWSKGMRQKLAIARSMIHDPEVALLDEPSLGLDPVATLDLSRHIRALAADRGATVLLTTHDLPFVEKTCSHVAVMHAGRLLVSATMEGFLASAPVVPRRSVEDVFLATIGAA